MKDRHPKPGPINMSAKEAIIRSVIQNQSDGRNLVRVKTNRPERHVTKIRVIGLT